MKLNNTVTDPASVVSHYRAVLGVSRAI